MSTAEFVSYHRDLETRPCLGMIRKDVAALRAQFPFLLALTLEYSSGPNGLPASSADHQRISKIEDKLESAARPGAEFLGHVTGGGRTVFLFASRTAQVAPVTVGTGLFKKETFSLVAPATDAWAWFESGLAPTAVEIAVSAYLPLYAQLKQHGDRHEATRPVDFAAFFPSADRREAFLAEVFGLGFTLGQQGGWEPRPGDFWCEFVKETAIEPSVMGPLVLELEALAARHGGEFDGWACPVVR